jgi:hypothetical protein
MVGKMKVMNKRGQVAIWIIVAIAIFITLSLLFFLKGKPKISESYDYGNPQAFIELCARNAILDAEKIIVSQGGFIEPRNFVSYNNVSIEYLCKNSGYFEPCIQQHPFLIEDIEKEIENYSKPIIKNCFQQLSDELKRNNKEVNFNGFQFDFYLLPNRIRSEIVTNLRISDGNGANTYENFKVELISPLYSLGRMALNIANDEAKYCYFEYVGYMALNKDLEISKKTLEDSSKIYSVKDVKSGQILNTAIRGCAIPAGY